MELGATKLSFRALESWGGSIHQAAKNCQPESFFMYWYSLYCYISYYETTLNCSQNVLKLVGGGRRGLQLLQYALLGRWPSLRVVAAHITLQVTLC
jgi:hypothetical protein